jgi:signal transduction histidine kinase
LHPDDTKPLKEYLSQAKPSIVSEIPLMRFQNTKGEWRWIESKVTDMSDNPEVAGYVFNCRDITEKILLEKELDAERLLKQHEITLAVISAQEQERQELGSELHDNVNQILAGSLLYLSLAKKILKIDHEYLKESDKLINTAITEIRNLSHSLIAPSLQESELLEALKTIIEVTHKTSGIRITLKDGSFDERLISDKLKLTIYRIVQEQLNNILKHASAGKVTIKLVQKNKTTLLCVKDDGVGFDTTKKAGGVGLLNIKTRASLFNGDVSIVSSPGKGCELKVLFK